MNTGGDAAEQIVRLSIEGMEAVIKVSGNASVALLKNVAVFLAAVIKQDHKSRGKASMGKMSRTGKELKIFSIPNKDYEKFAKEAKRYGVLFSAVKDKSADHGAVDIIAKAEDAAKIDRIVQRYALVTVDRGAVVTENEKSSEKQVEVQETVTRSEKTVVETVVEEKESTSKKQDERPTHEFLEKEKQERKKQNQQKQQPRKRSTKQRTTNKPTQNPTKKAKSKSKGR